MHLLKRLPFKAQEEIQEAIVSLAKEISVDAAVATTEWRFRIFLSVQHVFTSLALGGV